ncbi:6262_t:CDS:2 [Acaulospora morrowiae]|uniref:6262_t:CDS:1 n=1 Tax=Acaulospora morrowiae TaxID=94023 RepID=A0A9N8YZY0_9GLOM|nr:6262_t:CDS:2 [Acaulospora morrowiae]
MEVLKKSGCSLTLLILIGHLVKAHEHHHSTGNSTLGSGITSEPIDGILWAHIIFMTLAFGILFPTGMVLGLSKSRWHVPVQILGTSLATIGYFLGHAHGGREFEENIHSSFASYVVLLLLAQIGIGMFLKLHLERGPRWLRPMLVKFHKIFGIVIPVVSYIQIVFGAIVANGWCRGDHLGQCLAHFIMGSSFIGYGMVLIIMMRLGVAFLRRKRKSQDYYDSWTIMLWGLVNTFTEHRQVIREGLATLIEPKFLTHFDRLLQKPWSHKDLQHTALGLMWWAGGTAGVYLSRKGKRTIIPALVVIFTGFAMGSHAQSSEFSTKIHAIFGMTLVSAGIVRIIEITFLGNRKTITPLHHLSPYLLILSGLLFMGSNEEQVAFLEQRDIDPFSYALVYSTIAFLVFIYSHLQIDLYWLSGDNDGESKYDIAIGDTMMHSRNIPHIPLPTNDSRGSSASHDDDRMINEGQVKLLDRNSGNGFQLNELLVNQLDDDENEKMNGEANGM